MAQIVNIILLIDYIASGLFVFAFIHSIRNYIKNTEKSNQWLLVSVTFIFLFISNFSNILEWGGISSALDPAEDAINMLVAVIWPYLFYQYKKNL